MRGKSVTDFWTRAVLTSGGLDPLVSAERETEFAVALAKQPAAVTSKRFRSRHDSRGKMQAFADGR